MIQIDMHEMQQWKTKTKKVATWEGCAEDWRGRPHTKLELGSRVLYKVNQFPLGLAHARPISLVTHPLRHHTRSISKSREEEIMLFLSLKTVT